MPKPKGSNGKLVKNKRDNDYEGWGCQLLGCNLRGCHPRDKSESLAFI